MITTTEMIEARVRELRDEVTKAGRSDLHPVRDAVRWVRRRASH